MTEQDVEIRLVLPPRSRDALSDMLRHITRAIEDRNGEIEAYGLGGESGYGCPWDSAVFTMRRFYWGDCDCGFDQLEENWEANHTHSEDCYQADLRRAKIEAGATIHPQWGWASWPDKWSWKKREAVESKIFDELCHKHHKNRNFGAAAHCTCSYEKEWKKFSKANSHKAICSLELPNFRHHATGFEVRWYKYIGRGMETIKQPSDLAPIFNDCLRDIAQTPPSSGTQS